MATVYTRMCATWKRKLCAAGFCLSLISLSVVFLPAFHPGAKKLYNTVLDREVFAEDKLWPIQDYGPGGDNTVAIRQSRHRPRDDVTTPVDPGTNEIDGSRYARRHIPCSELLANDSATKGPITADTETLLSMSELEDELGGQLQLGGHFIPSYCRPTQRIAIIVPYRERQIHLKMFLGHMHPFLQRQHVEYYIVVVEQEDGMPFNRALLFNIGYKKMSKLHENIDCFIFHDVDLLPLDDRILYLCQDQPLHLSMLVDTLGDKLMYDNLFGGVVALTPEMMTTVNGFSNLYYGWGGEDDDMSFRIRSHGYSIDRYSKTISHYTMIRHGRDEDVNQQKLNTRVESGRGRIHDEGLNTLGFALLEFQPLPLYTWIYIRPNATVSWDDAN